MGRVRFEFKPVEKTGGLSLAIIDGGEPVATASMSAMSNRSFPLSRQYWRTASLYRFLRTLFESSEVVRGMVV